MRTPFYILAAVLAWQVAAIARPVEWIITHLTRDDTYLLLQVARNWADLGFPTFDGISRTNGFQALWGLMAVGLSGAVQDREATLRAVLGLCAVLNLATAAMVFRFTKRLAGTTAALWSLAFFASYVLTGHLSLIGLENSLHAFLTTFLFYVTYNIIRGETRRASWFWAGVYLGVNTWVRLDSIVISMVLGLGLSWFGLRCKRWRSLATMWLIFFLIVLSLAIFNMWAGGTTTPVSGLVKRHVAVQREGAVGLSKISSYVSQAVLHSLKFSSLALNGSWPRAVNTIWRVLLIFLPIVWLARRQWRLGSWAILWTVALFLHILTVYFWLSPYYAEASWYYGPVYVFASVAAGKIVADLQDGKKLHTHKTRWPAIWVCLQLSFALASLFSYPDEERTSTVQLETARWMDEHISSQDRVASWNAGTLTYFSQLQVVNLDGLMNDRQYYELMRVGQLGKTYFDKKSINWVVDYYWTSKIDQPDQPFWGILPRSEWEVIKVIGKTFRRKQVVVKRKATAGRT